MVSLQEGTLCWRKRGFITDVHSSFKKRKQDDGKLQTNLLNKGTNSENRGSIPFHVELQLRTPPPFDRQKRTEAKGQSRTSEGHSTYPEESASNGGPKMSLDLELNLLPSASPGPKSKEGFRSSIREETKSSKGETFTSSNKKSGIGLGLSRCPSWVAFEGEDDDDDQKKKKQEKVATVCMKCHMLVMLCKSAPVCPNCKFMHPHGHSSMDLFKPSSSLLSLLC
ncbi:PREDICTED: uncharacterized protein LOC104800151 [Tarenaya hassleriana]|uniref:uncharacterized protein LOC104800151 n=1 Tax=Tarenaya hassleriana TaxID=28532 RepID=UPI00053C99C9|nr:PREDICTED: uncharacterized protein LOC104800151 [Tarenaya hassleriana]